MLGFSSTFTPPSARLGLDAASDGAVRGADLQQAPKLGKIAESLSFQAAFAKSGTMRPALAGMPEQRVADDSLARGGSDPSGQPGVDKEEADSLDPAHDDDEEADIDLFQEGSLSLAGTEDDHGESTGEFVLNSPSDAVGPEPASRQALQDDALENANMPAENKMLVDGASAQDATRSMSVNPNNGRGGISQTAYRTAYHPILSGSSADRFGRQSDLVERFGEGLRGASSLQTQNALIQQGPRQQDLAALSAQSVHRSTAETLPETSLTVRSTTGHAETGQREIAATTVVAGREHGEVTQGRQNFDALVSHAPVRGLLLGGPSTMGSDVIAPGDYSGGQTAKTEASITAVPISKRDDAESRLMQQSVSAPEFAKQSQSGHNSGEILSDNAKRPPDTGNVDQLQKIARQHLDVGPATKVETTTLPSVSASPTSAGEKPKDAPQTERYSLANNANMLAETVPATDATRYKISMPADPVGAIFTPYPMEGDDGARTAALLDDRAIFGGPPPVSATTAEQRSATGMGGGTPQMARHVAIQLSDAAAKGADRPIDLTLNPSELGRVRITLTPGDGGMVVSVSAERPETLDLMRRHIDVLDQEFRDLGYSGTGFSFAQEEGGGRRAETNKTGDTSPRIDEHLDAGAAHSPSQDALGATTDRLDIRL